MKTIDKVRQYIRSISTSEAEYNQLLLDVYIDPNMRNNECKHPEQETCCGCPLNRWRTK